MTELIFGLTWEEIQERQQGKYRAPALRHTANPTATQADIEMLRNKGIEYIKGNLLWGVVDRLQTSGIIPREEYKP